MEGNISSTTRNIVKFGLEQLKLVERETEPYIQEPTTLQKYILEKRQHNTRDIAYHTEELAKAIDRKNGRIESYKQLRTDLDNTLLVEAKQKEAK